MPHASHTLTDRVRHAALDLGFADCGFTSAEPLECAALLTRWVADGRHGHMEWLDIDLQRRVDPRRFFEPATSIVVVALPYSAPPSFDPDWRNTLTGRVAAYAYGVDYHNKLTAMLEDLAARIDELSGGHARVHVDAGPMIEKDLARRAGLGWFGKNTNILSRERGSWVLLGCLFTDAPLIPDAPFTDEHCGTCTACIDDCPTGALDTGPTIDAQRCVSYLTIEHRGPIRADLRPLMGNWVFGCDDCQTVCPWGDSSGGPNAWLTPGLVDLLELDDESFRSRFANSAMSRAKPRMLARNAAIALGNSGNHGAMDALVRALREHPAPLVRAHAAWAIGEIAAPDAANVLDIVRAIERIPPVLTEIDSAKASVIRKRMRP